uniref:TEA domain-containing protein n=1 Tax=Heterorhabditis bacteriophora TaxID=37862 RepID=A0A1I7WS16_HETBA
MDETMDLSSQTTSTKIEPNDRFRSTPSFESFKKESWPLGTAKMNGGQMITAFQEALAIYPPCGRRKIIISDEGKMYASDYDVNDRQRFETPRTAKTDALKSLLDDNPSQTQEELAE